MPAAAGEHRPPGARSPALRIAWTLSRWLITSVAILVAVTGITFVLVAIAPGSAVSAVLGANTKPTPQQYQQVAHQLGIDHSLPEQYWHWLTNVLHGNLGTDLFNGGPVSSAINSRLGPTLSIVLICIVVAALLGVGIGMLSAVRGGILGRSIEFVAIGAFAIPNFWLAVILIQLLAVRVPLFPATGYTPLATDPAQWLRGITLPVVTLAFAATAFIARQARDALMTVLAREFITALRGQGLALRSIIVKHALRNAALPIVSAIGVVFIGLLGGTVIIESVFAVPGIGQLAVNATVTHDLPVIEAVALYFAVAVIAVNLVIDVSHRLLDPRLRGSA